MTRKACHLCGSGSDGKYLCETCRKAHRERNQQRRKSRKQDGLCPDCGSRPSSGRTLCDKCCTRNTIQQRSRKHKRNLAGQCAVCDSRKMSNLRLCKVCHKDFEEKKKFRRKRLIDEGSCSSCGKEPYLFILKNIDKDRKQCQTCHLKSAASGSLGSSKHWQLLLSILEQQNWTCPYSGDKIVLGINDSVDHILPVSKYPDRKFNITNIQWTTRTMNFMKSNLLDCEFLAEIEKVMKHLGNDLRRRIATKTYPLPIRESKLYHRLNQR